MVRTVLTFLSILFFYSISFADTNELLRKIENQQKILNMLKKQLVQQEKELAKLKLQLLSQSVDKHQKKEKTESKSNANSLKISGDFRARVESILPDDNSIEDRGRLRFRLRVSLEAKINSHFSFFGRLASGTDVTETGEHLGGSITSNNQTFDDFFEQKPIWIDRAFLNYKSSRGLIEFVVGKIGRPWKNS